MIINTMPFASQQTEAITFLSDEMTLALFGAGEEACFHYMDYLFIKVPYSFWVRKPAGSDSNFVICLSLQISVYLERNNAVIKKKS